MRSLNYGLDNDFANKYNSSIVAPCGALPFNMIINQTVGSEPEVNRFDSELAMEKIVYHNSFGYSVFGETLGEAWINAVECVSKNGNLEPDEKRERLALQNFRLKSHSQKLPDAIFDKYAKKENIEAMIDLVFKSDKMKDFDITPNFRVGAKSYKVRLEEGKMIDFVVDRLTKIPESKKAVMVFPTYEDYEQVKNNHFDDYLPCIVSLQFRLRPMVDGSRKLNTIFNMRSWNIDQKGAGDLTIFAMLNNLICEKLSNNLKIKVEPGSIDGMITDVHIYRNTFDFAHEIVSKYNNDLVNQK